MNTEDQRPNPDDLLRLVQTGEDAERRGRLKIFLGYAAGVGKTYAMLDAGRQRREEGVDVAVGYVETHGRAETEAMLLDLERVPRRVVQYRGAALQEMDVDAVLARRPRLALVDELAHTNVPGSRHPKRYQDVEELLSAGIDVYTTLNLQHIESLNDTVTQVTGIVVRETVPDRIVDLAADIELVDLPPEELQKRLREGKVYVPDQAARAIDRFFRTGNLNALRELSMRRTAERVDDQMLAYMQTQGIAGPWAAGERLLVCISGSPSAERLVRSTRRLAGEMKAEWIVLHVETPESASAPQAVRTRIAKAMLLAEELGGKSASLPAPSVAEGVLSFARRQNVTRILVGRPEQPRWRDLFRGSTVDQIIRHSGSFDIYVISPLKGAEEETRQPDEPQPRISWRPYAMSLVLVGAGTLLGALVSPFLSPTNLVMIYLLVAVVTAAFFGRGPSLLASVLGVVLFDFLFIPPFFTLRVSDSEYLLTMAALLVVSLVVSRLTVRVSEQAEAARRRELQTAELYALSRDLAAGADLPDILKAIVEHISTSFLREVAVLLPEAPGQGLAVRATSGGLALNEKQLAVAEWAYRNGAPAGRGTDTLASADIRCLPLKTANGVLGVLAVRPAERASPLSPDQRALLEAYASQCAIAVERARMADKAREAEVLQAADKLRTTMLNMISHDLRTPLVSILGALSGLQQAAVPMDEAARNALLDNARQEAERLNRLVGNLLDMTRMEAGALKLRKEPSEVMDLVATAMEQSASILGEHPVTTEIPESLPLVNLDFALMVQVLDNLLENAAKFSPPGSTIHIRAWEAAEATGRPRLGISVADRGPGIPAADLDRVFDRFFRASSPSTVRGTGLGLSICKGIVEAHGGTIRAEAPAEGGTVIVLTLPLKGAATDDGASEAAP